MTTGCTVPPPAQGEWYDLEETVAAVLGRLRLREGDVDEGRVRTLVPVAAGLVNAELDRVHPMTAAGTVDTDDVDADADVTEELLTNVTPNVLEALVVTTVELYGQRPINGVAFPVDTSTAIEPALGLLTGAKSRWGIA